MRLWFCLIAIVFGNVSSVRDASARRPSVTSPESKPPTQDRHDFRLWQYLLTGGSWQRQPYFVRAGDTASLRLLKTLGIQAQRDRWTLVQLDDGALLHALQASTTKLEIQTAPRHKPLGAVNLQAIGLSKKQMPLLPVRPVPSNNPLLHGQGVLLGFIDTGLDLEHPAFINAEGQTRVVSVWDQDAPKTATLVAGHFVPEAFGYGHACDASALRAQTCSFFTDPTGHGTHVASIAAGSDPNALGVAPEADIAVVRSDDFTRLADAIAYLYNLAEARQQPLVINISVGGHYGAHDGRTPLEQYINALPDQGRALVVAAGNDGTSTIHAQVEVQGLDAPRFVGLEDIPAGTPGTTVIEFWGTVGTDISWQLELHDGTQVLATLPLTQPVGQTMGHGLLTYHGRTLADVSFGRSISNNRMLRYGLAFNTRHTHVLPAHLQLVLRFSGYGKLQGWIDQGQLGEHIAHFSTHAVPQWIPGDAQRSIAVPATALRVMSVGSYLIPVDLGDRAETPHASTPPRPFGARSLFSSQGPTGFTQWTGSKPDLCAPGEMVLGARSRSVSDSPFTLNATQMLMQGTSMAAPHVSGTIALMLQVDPTLSSANIRRILRQTAKRDSFTGDAPSDAWGHGKLDAYAALTRTQQETQSGCQQSRAAYVWVVILAIFRLTLRRDKPSL